MRMRHARARSWSRLGLAVPVLVVLLVAAGLAWAGGPWGDGVNLSNNPGSSRTPRLAIGSGSTAWAVWMDDTPGAYQILARRGTAAGWNATTNVSSVGVDYAKDPAVAVYPTDNKAYFAWSEHRTGNWEIAFRQFDPAGGGTWTPALASDPDNISGTADGLSQSPALAVTPDGTLTAVWADDGHIWFRQRPGTGGAWSAKIDITGPTSTGGDLPSIAVASNGAVYVAWEWSWTNFDTDPIQYRNDIAFRKYSGGVWSPALSAPPVNASNSTRISSAPVVVADSGDNARLVWQSWIFQSIEPYEKESDVYYRKHTGTTWSGGITDITSEHSYKAYAPSIATTSGGKTYIVWEQAVSSPFGNRDIYYRSSTGDSWPLVTGTNLSGNTGLSRNPAVATRGSSALLAWEDITGLSEGDIFTLANFTGPTGLVAGDHPGDTGYAIDLTWTASADPNVIGYYIVRSYQTGNIWTPWAHETIAGPVAGTTYTDSTVPENLKTYYYTVRSSDGAFVGTPSTTASAQAQPSETTPPNTTSQVVGDKGTNSRTGLTSWYIGDVTASAKSNEDGKIVYNWNGTANTTINGVTADTTQVIPGGIPNEGANTLNYFGIDISGNKETPANSDTYRKDTQAPSPPTGVAGAELAGPMVRATWSNNGTDPSPGSGRDHYNVLMGPASGPYLWVADVVGTSYETQAVDGNTYEFVIQTEDVAGHESGNSVPASVTVDGADLETDLTVASDMTTVTYGQSPRLSGWLTSGLGMEGRPVELKRKYVGEAAYTTIGVAITSGGGYWSRTNKPLKGGYYMAHFAASGPYQEATSTAVYVKVKTKVTIYTSRTSVPRGTAMRIYGTVSPRHSYKYVDIQLKSGTTWRTLARPRLNSLSRYAWNFRPSQNRLYKLRTRFVTSGDHGTGYSRELQVRGY